jgi:hypothetical protein
MLVVWYDSSIGMRIVPVLKLRVFDLMMGTNFTGSVASRLVGTLRTYIPFTRYILSSRGACFARRHEPVTFLLYVVDQLRSVSIGYFAPYASRSLFVTASRFKLFVKSIVFRPSPKRSLLVS